MGIQKINGLALVAKGVMLVRQRSGSFYAEFKSMREFDYLYALLAIQCFMSERK